MITKSEMIMELVRALSMGNVDWLSRNLSEDFEFFDSLVSKKMSKKEYVSFIENLHRGIPDLDFHVSDMRGKGDMVRCKFHLTGTNTGELTLPHLELYNVPPTGKCFSQTEERAEVKVRDGKITAIRSTATSKGDTPGMLRQLGIRVPELVRR